MTTIQIIADHVKITGHNIKWNHFDFFVSGKIRLSLQDQRNIIVNVKISSEKLTIYQLLSYINC